ncbi:hypothetical protein PPYR_10389 [Photinus pyralis]|uniref:Uncharacterized protein n=1 Tax=Photinus pyralis TaxID=7054 RepID=A0A5N4AGJ1_PHOPY|nr:hypothetical protein PPYR_10389 [Photinus pyralis]
MHPILCGVLLAALMQNYSRKFHLGLLREFENQKMGSSTRSSVLRRFGIRVPAVLPRFYDEPGDGLTLGDLGWSFRVLNLCKIPDFPVSNYN